MLANANACCTRRCSGGAVADIAGRDALHHGAALHHAMEGRARRRVRTAGKISCQVTWCRSCKKPSRCGHVLIKLAFLVARLRCQIHLNSNGAYCPCKNRIVIYLSKSYSDRNCGWNGKVASSAKISAPHLLQLKSCSRVGGIETAS
jgi:hypothetical protein